MVLSVVPTYPDDTAAETSVEFIDPRATVQRIAKEGAHPEYLVFQGQLGAPKIPLPSSNAYGHSGQSRQQLNIWDLINDAVDGTGGFVDGSYLVPHELELVDSQMGAAWALKFQARMQLARYDNFAKLICDGPWNSIIAMKDLIVRDAGPHARLAEFWDDVDGSGTHIVDFLEYPVNKGARRFGTGWIFMDREKNIATLKDDLASKPWAYTVPTRNVVWWEHDKLGGLELVAYRDPVPPEERTWKADLEPLVIWTRTSYSRWIPTDSKDEPYAMDVANSGPNRLGTIPAVQIYDEQPGCGKAFGSSNMLTVARCAVDVFNRDSEIREIERMAAFPLLHVNIDDIADAASVNIGLKGVLITDGKIEPNYLEPALNSIDKLQSESIRVKDAAFVNSEMTGLLGHTQAMQTTSGFHAEVELDKSERRIGKLAASVETAENKLARLFLALIGEPDEGYSISYPRKFGLTDTDTLVARTRDRLALGLGQADTFETLTDYYSGIYPRKTAKEIKELATSGTEARAVAPPLVAVQVPGQPRADRAVPLVDQPGALTPVQTARQRLGLQAKAS